jgi:hypothetical protein
VCLADMRQRGAGRRRWDIGLVRHAWWTYATSWGQVRQLNSTVSLSMPVAHVEPLPDEPTTEIAR